MGPGYTREPGILGSRALPSSLRPSGLLASRSAQANDNHMFLATLAKPIASLIADTIEFEVLNKTFDGVRLP